MNELNPCYVCDSESIKIEVIDDYFQAVCENCGDTGTIGDTENDAIELWNNDNERGY